MKATVTPGIKALPVQIAVDALLDPTRHTMFRGIAARANYLAAGRPDCQFAAKEICRWMSAPTELALQALKRLCRYLVGRPRLVFKTPSNRLRPLIAIRIPIGQGVLVHGNRRQEE